LKEGEKLQDLCIITKYHFFYKASQIQQTIRHHAAIFFWGRKPFKGVFLGVKFSVGQKKSGFSPDQIAQSHDVNGFLVLVLRDSKKAALFCGKNPSPDHPCMVDLPTFG